MTTGRNKLNPSDTIIADTLLNYAVRVNEVHIQLLFSGDIKLTINRHGVSVVRNLLYLRCTFCQVLSTFAELKADLLMKFRETVGYDC